MRYTVWERSGNDLIRKLFTGCRDECLDAMKHLLRNKRWPVDSIELVDDSTGRCCSWVLK